MSAGGVGFWLVGVRGAIVEDGRLAGGGVGCWWLAGRGAWLMIG